MSTKPGLLLGRAKAAEPERRLRAGRRTGRPRNARPGDRGAPERRRWAGRILVAVLLREKGKLASRELRTSRRIAEAKTAAFGGRSRGGTRSARTKRSSRYNLRRYLRRGRGV